MDSDASSAGLDPVDALAEEYLKRRRRGERPTRAEYAARYPEHAARILELFPALELIEGLKPAPDDHSGFSSDAGGGVEPGAGSGRARRLGDYTLLRELGRGGMGIVYEAEHESLKNQVALKVMHPRYRADRDYVRRFQTEARSAAKLHHTNIVPVFDYGEQDGVCYYAMQCIAGVGLEHVLDDVRRLRAAADRHIGARTGGEGAVPVTAVSRSLLTGRFADATTASFAPAPSSTATQVPDGPGPVAVSGTHAGAGGSASAPSSGEVSSASNSFASQSEPVYFREVARLGAQVADALHYAHRQGVVHRDIKPSNLLLDGQGNVWITDFGLAKLVQGDELSQSHDLVGTLRFMAPERFRGVTSPLGDVYSLGATLYELLTLKPAFGEQDQALLIDRIAHQPPTPLRQQDPRIPRDLETLVQKALAKDAKDRFVSAAELRDELRRYLESRPILSRPVGPVERLWRWCLRNRWIAGMTGVAAVAACVGLAALVAVVVLQHRANQALQTSNLNLLAANTREQRAHRLAQTRYALAHKAVEAYYTGASEDVLLKQPELESLRKRLLQTALEFYREMVTTLAESPDDTSTTRDELARAYFVVASVTAEVGSKEDALAAFQMVRATLEGLLREKPGDGSLRRRLAHCLQVFASLSQSTGRRDDAARAYTEGLALRERLLEEHPDDATLLRETAWTLQSFGNFQKEHGPPENALLSFRHALVHHEKVARLRPEDIENQNERADVLHDIGLLQGRTDQEEGARVLEKAVDIHRRIVRDHPNEDRYLKSLAASCNDLAGLHWRLDRFDEALNRYQEALTLDEDLARRHPTINELRNRVSSAHYNIGLVHSAANRLDQALQSFRSALPIQEALIEAHPTVVDYQISLSRIYFQLGYLHRRLGHRAEATSWYGKALLVQEAVHRANPGLIAATESLAWTCNNLGYLEAAAGRTNEALRSYGRAVQYRRQLVESDPFAFLWRRELAWSYHCLSGVKRNAGDSNGAMEAIRQAVAIAESMVREHADDNALKRLLNEYQIATAALLLRIRHTSEALDLARRAAAHGEDDYRRNPSQQPARRNLVASLIVLGNAHLASGDPVAAERSYEQARPIMESLIHPNETDHAGLSRIYALLSSCPAPGGPPPTPEGHRARQALADRAVRRLRRAVDAGYQDLYWVRTEVDLDALRTREDFQTLFNDMAFPSDPFAP